MRLLPASYFVLPRPFRASRAGQSLVEAVIAISVLTTGFLGISSLLARSLFLSRVVSDQITANYLAAEGIEVAKNLIDHDVFESLSPNPSFVWGLCFSVPHNDVELDYTTADCSNLSAFDPSHPLKLDPVTHLYSYNPPLQDNPAATNFTREILVSEDVATTEITVKSIVSWSTATVIGQSLKLEDHFYDWRSASST